MKNLNEDHIHIWCYSHVLNLVIGDILNINIKAASLFTLLNCICVFFKDSHKRMDIFDFVSTDSKHKRLQSIGETRWWAKEAALKKVFGETNNPESGLYAQIIQALDDIENDRTMKVSVRATSKTYKEGLLKFDNIVTAQIFMKIFSSTGPLSRYLQTKGIDLLKCNSMVQTAINDLTSFQRDFTAVTEATAKFITWVKAKEN